jgi:hypothetical protein
MEKLRYSAVKDRLARQCSSSGLPSSSSRVLDYVNRAQEELMLHGDFQFSTATYQFRIFNKFLVLPGDVDSVINMAVNDTPFVVSAPWYEWSPTGPGPQSEDRQRTFKTAVDKGYRCTVRDIPNEEGKTYTIRAESKVPEASATIRIFGYDENGEWVKSLENGIYVDGELLTIPSVNPPYIAETTHKFSAISGVIKSETARTITLWAHDGTESTFLAQYASKETDPNYQSYFLPNVNTDDTVVTARCRRRYAPVTGDDDYLFITVLPALENMIRAIVYRESGNGQLYAIHRNMAVDLLNKEHKRTRGRHKNPGVAVFGTGFKLPNVR